MSDNYDPLKYFGDVYDFWEALDPETDRGCALMSAAFIDVELERLMTKHFVNDPAVVKELTGQNRPLGTFSSRIDLCYVVGLIGKKTRRDLHLIRKIRNDFAHEPKPLTFEQQTIAARCDELYHDGLHPAESPPRRRFTRTVINVLAVIHGQLQMLKPTEPKEDLVFTDEIRTSHRTLVDAVMADLKDRDKDAEPGEASNPNRGVRTGDS